MALCSVLLNPFLVFIYTLWHSYWVSFMGWFFSCCCGVCSFLFVQLSWTEWNGWGWNSSSWVPSGKPTSRTSLSWCLIRIPWAPKPGFLDPHSIDNLVGIPSCLQTPNLWTALFPWWQCVDCGLTAVSMLGVQLQCKTVSISSCVLHCFDGFAPQEMWCHLDKTVTAIEYRDFSTKSTRGIEEKKSTRRYCLNIFSQFYLEWNLLECKKSVELDNLAPLSLHDSSMYYFKKTSLLEVRSN